MEEYEMETQTINTIIDIIMAIVGSSGFSAIVFKLFQYLHQVGVDKKIQNITTLSEKAVTSAAQVGINLDLDGPKIYELALQAVQVASNKAGIKKTDEEWEMYLESAYKMLSKEWKASSDIIALTINSDSIQTQIEAIPVIPEVIESPESIAVPSVESIPEIIPETQNIPDLTIGDVVLTDNSPISTIPIVVDTVNNAITDQIKLLAQQTANTTITNIVNQAINDALIKATTPVG